MQIILALISVFIGAVGVSAFLYTRNNTTSAIDKAVDGLKIDMEIIMSQEITKHLQEIRQSYSPITSSLIRFTEFFALDDETAREIALRQAASQKVDLFIGLWKGLVLSNQISEGERIIVIDALASFADTNLAEEATNALAEAVSSLKNTKYIDSVTLDVACHCLRSMGKLKKPTDLARAVLKSIALFPTSSEAINSLAREARIDLGMEAP